MKTKTISILIITVVLVCIMVLLVTMFFLIKLNDRNENADVSKNVIENTVNSVDNNISNDEDESTENIEDEQNDNETGYDFEPDGNEMNYTQEDALMLKREGIMVPSDEIDENGNVKFSDKEINDFQFEINGLSDEILEYVKDVDKLKFEIKKYIYSNPEFLNITAAKVSDYKFQNQGSTLTIYFDLSDNIRFLVVSVDLEDDNISVNVDFKD